MFQGPHYIRTYLSCAIITIFRYMCLILDIRAGALKLDILCALIKSFHGSVQHFIYCYSLILNISLGKMMASISKQLFLMFWPKFLSILKIKFASFQLIPGTDKRKS